MTTLSLLNNGDIGFKYLFLYPDRRHVILRYTGDHVGVNGAPLKRFERINPPFLNFFYSPNDVSFDLQKMPDLPDDVMLNISEYASGMYAGGKRKRRGSKRRSSKRRSSKRRSRKN